MSGSAAETSFLSLEEKQKRSLAKPESRLTESNANYKFDTSELSHGVKNADPNPQIPVQLPEVKTTHIVDDWKVLVDEFHVWKMLDKLYPRAKLNKLVTQNVGENGDCWYYCMSTIYNGYHNKGFLDVPKTRLMTAEMITEETVDPFLTASTSTRDFPANVILRIPDITQRIQTTKQIVSKMGNSYWGETVTWTHLLSKHPVFVKEKIGLVTLYAYWDLSDKTGIKTPKAVVQVYLQSGETDTLFYVINLGNEHYQMLGHVVPNPGQIKSDTDVSDSNSDNSDDSNNSDDSDSDRTRHEKRKRRKTKQRRRKQKKQSNQLTGTILYRTPKDGIFPQLKPFTSFI